MTNSLLRAGATVLAIAALSGSGITAVAAADAEPVSAPAEESGAPSAAPAAVEPSVESTPEPSVSPASEPTPTPTYAPGMAPGEHAEWAAVDPEGNVRQSGFVCTPEVCGQTGPGSWLELVFGSGTDLRLIVKSLQDPVEAANSPNGIGNVVASPGGRYDWDRGAWIREGEGGQVYEIPLGYPGTDRGGNSTVDVLLYDPTDDDSITDVTPALTWVAPDERDEAEEAQFMDSVRAALPTVDSVTASTGVVFTDAAAERRTVLGTNIANAVGRGSTATGVAQAEKLVWLYTWAAVRALGADERGEVSTQLRTASADSAVERQIRAQAKELALIDVAASLNLTPLSAVPSDRDACAVALTNAQGRIARGACSLPGV